MDAEATASRPGLFARTTATVIRKALTLRIVRAFLLYTENRGPLLADAVTYRALFSVFAGVLLGFSASSLWLSSNPVAWKAVIDAVGAAVPGLVGDSGLVDPDDITFGAGVTVAGIVSLIALIGAALGAIGSLRVSIRTIADTDSVDVLWLWVVLRNLALAIGIGASFLVSAALTFAGRILVTWLTEALGIPDDAPAAVWGVRLASVLVVYALDVALIAVIFRLLSGLRPSARSMWEGALLGGVGLLVLQELSGLFVGGATSNPLLASFAGLLALLIWLNLSAQVMLIASAYIVTATEDAEDRVHSRFGAQTFAQRRVRRAERSLAVATGALQQARDVERTERESSRS